MPNPWFTIHFCINFDADGIIIFLLKYCKQWRFSERKTKPTPSMEIVTTWILLKCSESYQTVKEKWILIICMVWVLHTPFGMRTRNEEFEFMSGSLQSLVQKYHSKRYQSIPHWQSMSWYHFIPLFSNYSIAENLLPRQSWISQYKLEAERIKDLPSSSL